MYFTTPVSVPVVPGKITFRKKNDHTYVLLETGRVYKPEKQHNIPQRVIIGKLVSPSDRTMMLPNETFKLHFPSVKFDETEQPRKRSCTLRAGSFIAFEKIIKEYGLDRILDGIFGNKSALILDLACYMIVNEDNAGQYYPDYARCHPLFTSDMRILSDSTVSRLLSGITEDDIIAFLEEWNGRQDHRQKIYISYDSTNKNSQAGELDFAEFGHAKEDKGVPLINISLAFDKTNRVPLFYEEYPGSVNDVSQLKYLVDKVIEYGYRSIGLILDRGYCGAASLDYMDEQGLSFLLMLKGHKALVSQLIMERFGSFEYDHNCVIQGTEISAVTVERELREGDGRKRCFHICYNPLKMSAERSQFHLMLDKLEAEFRKFEGHECSFDGSFTQYFNCHYKEEKGKKIFLCAERNNEAINRTYRLLGYFCLISSDKMTAEDAYLLYRGRDASEKLFRAQKTFLGSKSMRAHSNEAVSARIFIEFLALIIRNRFYNLLKDEMRRLKVRRNYMTVPAAIRELEKIEMTKRSSGSLYRLDYALTRTQKSILQCFGLSADDVLLKTQELAVTLEKVNDVLSTEEEEQDDGTTQEC